MAEIRLAGLPSGSAGVGSLPGAWPDFHDGSGGSDDPVPELHAGKGGSVRLSLPVPPAGRFRKSKLKGGELS